MKSLKKIHGYQPSNKRDILNLILTSRLFSLHGSLENGGISTFEKHGTLNTQYPDIFNEFCTYLLGCLDSGYSVMDMWANIYPPRSFVKPHHHLNTKYPDALAGVYYLKKPETSGNLVIENAEIEVAENDLVLFEGKKMHWTRPNMSGENRIILSFNLIQTA